MQKLQRISLSDIESFLNWAKNCGAGTAKHLVVERIIHDRIIASPLSAVRYLGIGADGIVLEDSSASRVLKITELMKGTPMTFNHVAREVLIGAYVHAARLDPRYSWAQFLVGTHSFGAWEPTWREAEILRVRPALRTHYVTGIPQRSKFAPFVELTDVLSRETAAGVRRERLRAEGRLPVLAIDDRSIAELYIGYLTARFGSGVLQFAQFAIQEQQLVRGKSLHALIREKQLLEASSGGRWLRAIIYVLLQMLARLGAEPQRFVHMDLQLRNIMMQPIADINAFGAYSQLKRPDGASMAAFLQGDLHGTVPVLIDLTTARFNAVLDDKAKATELNGALRLLASRDSAARITGAEDVRRLGLYLVHMIAKRVRRAQRVLIQAKPGHHPAEGEEEVPTEKHDELLRSIRGIDQPLLHIAMRMISVPVGWFDESTLQCAVMPNWSFVTHSLAEYTEALSHVYGYMQMVDRVISGQMHGAERHATKGVLPSDQSVVASLLISASVIDALEKLIHDLNPYMGAVFSAVPELARQELAWTPSEALKWHEWQREWAWYSV